MEVLGRQRAKLRNTVHQYNGTQYYTTETFLLTFPFLQNNITSEMWPRTREQDKKTGNFTKHVAHYLPV